MTPAELYDQLHEMFGIGDYDDIAAANEPWYRSRMTEISKLKAMLKRRHCTIEEVQLAAAYARDTGKPIHATWQLFVLVPEALKVARKVRAERALTEVREEVESAAHEALAAGDIEWADRLMRAPEASAATVLNQWRNRDG